VPPRDISPKDTCHPKGFCHPETCVTHGTNDRGVIRQFVLLENLKENIVVNARTIVKYIGVVISLWLFLFPIFLLTAQQKELFVDGLTKLEQ
jgi:hypothetical protein